MGLLGRWLAWWRARSAAGLAQGPEAPEASPEPAGDVLPVRVPDPPEGAAAGSPVPDPEPGQEPQTVSAPVPQPEPVSARAPADVPLSVPGAVPNTAPRRPQRSAAKPPRSRGIRLALQGGGSHGAFTWGALDRLLADDRLGIDAISGASAGALNAAVLATGWVRGGRAGAREALAGFWRDVGRTGALFSPFPAVAAAGFGFDALPGYGLGRSVMRSLSPYDFNPLNVNPLRDVVARHVDEDALRSGPIRLFVTATAVRSGRPRVFSGAGLGLDALLASACLPFLFQAVEIGGEPYWDGGYSGNPSLYPLLEPGGGCDLVIVRINPARREGTPRRSAEIMDRVGEITFNAPLIGELRAIALVNRLLREGALARDRYRELRLHVIADDEDLAALPASSRLRADRALVDRLHGYGRAAAERFLAAHADALGRRSSVDVEVEFPSH